MMRFAGHVYCIGGEEIHGVWFVKPEGNRALKTPRRIWKDNIKTDLKE
jgi:hypothetical protein